VAGKTNQLKSVCEAGKPLCTLTFNDVRLSNISLENNRDRLFKPAKSYLYRPRLNKSLDLQISSLVGYFNKMNVFLVYTLRFHETVHDKRCFDNGKLKMA